MRACLDHCQLPNSPGTKEGSPLCLVRVKDLVAHAQVRGIECHRFGDIADCQNQMVQGLHRQFPHRQTGCLFWLPGLWSWMHFRAGNWGGGNMTQPGPGTSWPRCSIYKVSLTIGSLYISCQTNAWQCVESESHKSHGSTPLRPET